MVAKMSIEVSLTSLFRAKFSNIYITLNKLKRALPLGNSLENAISSPKEFTTSISICERELKGVAS